MSDLAVTPDDSEPKTTVLGPLEKALGLLVAVVLFYLMALRCIDVVGRYGFNAPVPGASELTGLGLALLIFGALPIVTAHSEHVSVSLLEMLIGQRSRRVERFFLLTTSVLVLTVVAWRLWVKAGVLASYSDSTSYLRVPLAPFAYFMSAMTAAAAIVVVLQIVAALRAARDGKRAGS
jgi:TRAP-type C4-dicarboxylate transport system permease small subunit